jgi:REP element-mobilizing transposase RayT
MRVQVPRRIRVEVPQAAVWANQAGPGHSIPPKYSVAEVSSIWIAQNVERKLRNFLGHKFWARGYFVSTVGRDKGTIRTYIKNQEIADKAVESVATEACVLIKSHLLYQNPS